MKPIVIAIDGPSGAGKGTVARTVSHVLGFRHIDTGAMYRAVGWKALHDAIALDDEPSVAALAQRADIEVEAGLVFIDGHDVTQAIRTPEMDKTAAAVARLPKVREVLVARQRALGERGGVVMEGRDIGTVVFPNAQLKIYLDASDRRARPPAGQRHRAHGQSGGAGGGRRGHPGARSVGQDTRRVAADAGAGCGPHRHDRHAHRRSRAAGARSGPGAIGVAGWPGPRPGPIKETTSTASSGGLLLLGCHLLLWRRLRRLSAGEVDRPPPANR